MRRRIPKVSAGALWLALGVSLAFAMPAQAATWTDPVDAGPPGSTVYGFVTTPPTSAVILYGDGSGLFVTVSANYGLNWSTPVQLSSGSSIQGAAMAARGSFVDVIWSESYSLHYARSDDGGASFDLRKTVPASTNTLLALDVDRGPDDTVAMTWTTNGKLRTRVSTNGGATFHPRFTLADSAVDADVEVGDGVVYVVCQVGFSLRMRRSLDDGLTWKPWEELAKTAGEYEGFDIAAAGTYAYLVFTKKAVTTVEYHQYIQLRKTANRGRTWSAPVDLSPPLNTRRTATSPAVSHSDGITRVAFTRCITLDACDINATSWQVFYRESSDGASWSPPEAASDAYESNEWGSAGPIGLGAAGETMLVFFSPNGTFLTTREP